MKIKILDFANVKEVQEIVRDMNIKQPTFGYSDIFSVPNDESDYFFDVLKRKNIKWEKIKKNESYLKKSTIKENVSLDSDYLQRQLKILADDMKSDDPDIAKAYLFIRDRLHQSFPDGDVSREDIQNILREPQSRKYVANLPDWALDHIFESRISRKKSIKESRISSWINEIITEEIRKVRLKESSFKRVGDSYISSKGLTIKFEKVASFLYASIYLTGIPNKPLKNLTSEPISSVKDVLNWADGLSSKFDFSKIKSEKDWNNLGKDKQDKIYRLLQSGNALASRLKGANKGHFDVNSYDVIENTLKENQSQQEIEDLAVDLIDYMGKQLPVTGWNKNPRIMGFFREQGILDGKIIQQIYQKAIQMNAE